jgi:TolA-binding protein
MSLSRSQISVCISGANNAIPNISRALDCTAKEKGYLRDASVGVENGYCGVSSKHLDEKILSLIKETDIQSGELSNCIRDIQNIVNDLVELDRQLEYQERMERERQERARQEAARQEAARQEAARQQAARQQAAAAATPKRR